MTFLSLEKLGGKPVELYIFQLGTENWRYTDGRGALTVNGLAYQPATISRSEQTDSQEESQSTLTVTLDRQLPVVAGMLAGSPRYRQTSLAVFRYQPGATDKALIASGRVSSVRWRGTSVEVTILQTASLLQQPVPRKTFLPTCNHMVYDAYCGAKPQEHSWPATVLSVFAQGAVGGSPDGPSFTVDAVTSPYDEAGAFAAGYCTGTGVIGTIIGVVIGSGTEPVFIIQHTVSAGVALIVCLSSLPSVIIPGANIFLTEGCDGTYDTCRLKFGNLANFFGFPFMPTKNPFTQGLR